MSTSQPAKKRYKQIKINFEKLPVPATRNEGKFELLALV